MDTRIRRADRIAADQLILRLRARREELQLSQCEVAARMGCSRNYVQLVEAGELQPTLSRFLGLLRVLGLDPQYPGL